MPPLHRLVAGMVTACALAGPAIPVAQAEYAPLASQVDHFVKVSGDRFVVDGKPFVFVGANVEALQGEKGRARYRETLGAVAADGLRVARVWAFGEGPADASDWHRREVLFRAGPSGFVDAAYQHLDRVLAEARADKLRVIVTLGNNWDDYGGIPMYLRWAGLPPGTGPDDPAREAFYSDAVVRDFFRAGVARLLERTNSVTGVRYADDPTIFSWELLNESTVVTPDGADARRAWIAEMARFIHARDPHHLVAAGLMGYGNRDARAEWVRVHRLPEIDYCDSHLYPEGADAVRRSPRWRARQAEQRLFDFLDDRAQLARFVVGKPLVLGEFGFRTDGPTGKRGDRGRPDAGHGEPPIGLCGQPRERWFRRLLERFFRDGGAGALVWIYQPWSGRARDFGIYIDRPDTDDVRAVLRACAALASATPAVANDRLGLAVGERLLYDAVVTVPGRPRPHRLWTRDAGARALAIPPDEFVDARFESAGVSKNTALAYAWGSGAGRFRYRFDAPVGFVPARVRVFARLSSEWPGERGPPGGTSIATLLLDGIAIGTRAVPTDDGAGATIDFTTEDRALLRRLALPGPHTLTLSVPDEPRAHGLCVYGAPTGLGARPAPDGAGPLRIVYEPRATVTRGD